MLSPSPQGNNLHLYINLHLYLDNCISFCIFSHFYWGRAKFNKFDCILALCMFICLCKLEIIQYILKYKCICVCILSYYTYSGTEYSESLLDNNTWVLYCILADFPLCTSLGCFVHPVGEYSNCPPNRGMPYKSLVFWLKCTVNGSGHSCMYQLCQYRLLALCIHVWALISTLAYYLQGFPHWWHHGDIPMKSSGVGVPSPTVISYGTNSNTWLFVWFSPYSETFFLSHTCISFPIG